MSTDNQSLENDEIDEDHRLEESQSSNAGPSRRTVAKGAAWTAPVIIVGAAAPSIAGSPLSTCANGTVSVDADCGSIIDRRSLRFSITNPATSGCMLPAGTPLSLTTSGLAGATVSLLNGVNVDVVFSETGTAVLAQDLMPGQTIYVNPFPPSLLSAGLVGNTSLTINGVTDSAQYATVGVGLLGLHIAVCGELAGT